MQIVLIEDLAGIFAQCILSGKKFEGREIDSLCDYVSLSFYIRL